MKVLSFGEIIWDVYPDKKCIGGAPFNFSAHVAKQGVQSFLLSCVGKDDLGKQAKQYLAKFGVKSDFVFECDKQTGVCKVELDEKGVPSYTIVDKVAYDYIPFEQNVTKEKFDLFCFGSLALRGENNKAVLQKLLEQGNFAKIYCDLNLRVPFFDKATIDFCFKNSHIAKVSDNEFSFVSQQVLGERYSNVQQFAKSLSQAYKNLEVVLLTCGDKGAYAYRPQQDQMYFEPAKKVEVTSTVGAGDCFGAVFVTGYLGGKSVQSCLQKATEKSAYVVSKQDAVPD